MKRCSSSSHLSAATDRSEHALFAHLSGGDLRQLGASGQLLTALAHDPTLLSTLMAGLDHPDRRVRMRCADVVEKFSSTNALALQAWAQPLLQSLPLRHDKEMRWHLAQLLPRFRWSAADASQLAAWLTACLEDDSRIVRCCALEGRLTLATHHRCLQATARAQWALAMESPIPSLRARARRLKAAFDDGPPG